MKTVHPADPLRANEDAFCLTSARRGAYPIPVWDEGFGSLWAVLDNVGVWAMVIGIIRARNLYEAWQCAEDEIFPAPDEDDLKAWLLRQEQLAQQQVSNQLLPEIEDLPDGWGYRGSGEPSNHQEFWRVSGLIYERTNHIKDPIVPLTKEIMLEHQLTINWELYPELTRRRKIREDNICQKRFAEIG
jgi:hypothetical protein